jgi:alkaline phosphatase
MKRIVTYILLTLTLICATGCKQKAKYVFLFIGDGMGFGAVSVTEAYLAQGEAGSAQGMGQLAFSDFPVMGAASTYSANAQVTDSAASGSALSTGEKVDNDSICIGPDGDTLVGIAYKIHDAGYKVGITATVCIDHATPAAFYGRSLHRGYYYEIGSRLADSGFEYFAGGDFNRPDENEPSCYAKAEAAGYAIAYGRDDFEAKKDSDKIVFFQKRDTTHAMTQLPTRLERIARNNPDDISLKEMVARGIEHLDGGKGFFMMAEGSMIDFAAHSNDVPGLIFETIDMSDAIEVAKEFYGKHPKNTLIVVTADHETGGPSCNKHCDLAKVKEMCSPAGESTVDNYMDGHISREELSKAAHIGWTTGSHTGDRVPVYAIGCGSEKFAGEIDNTDIPRKICEAMGIEF